MNRRQFIRNSISSSLALPLLINGVPLSAISGRRNLLQYIDSDSDRVLVLIQLNGGNDGLSTLFPLDQYDQLANVRQNIIIPENNLLSIGSLNALHPSMEGIQRMYENAKVTFVQSVGYPQQDRSHFRSMDIWNTASAADEFLNTGWLGRYFDECAPGYPSGYPNADFPDPIAINVGYTVSETCQGSSSNFSMAIVDPENLAQLATGGSDEVPDSPYGHELTFLRNVIQQTNAYAEGVENAASQGNNLSMLYDADNPLAQQLKTVARLISGGLRTKVYVVTLGGFDTHSEQVVDGEPDTGVHAELLSQLSNAMEAFQEDIQKLGLQERVIGMTYSEFGRQIASNLSWGTDHGTAAPLMFFGNCVNAGIFGDNPEIPDTVAPQEGVPMQFDFRSLYGSVLMDWFGLAEETVKDLLFEGFQYVPVLQPCAAVGTQDRQSFFTQSLDVVLSPNPFREQLIAEFASQHEWGRLSLINSMGQEVRTIYDGHFAAGAHRVPIDGRGLAPGNYYVRVLFQDRQCTKMAVRL